VTGVQTCALPISIKFLKGQIPAGVRITLDISEDIHLPADRQRLQQVLLNLIKNAVEATGTEGEVRVSAHSVASISNAQSSFPTGCLVDDDALDILIADSGHGIPSDLLPRIFDPFFTTKDVGHGMGLGLFIVTKSSKNMVAASRQATRKRVVRFFTFECRSNLIDLQPAWKTSRTHPENSSSLTTRMSPCITLSMS
jgi:K+-sensing histidine kinase KdpD